MCEMTLKTAITDKEEGREFKYISSLIIDMEKKRIRIIQDEFSRTYHKNFKNNKRSISASTTDYSSSIELNKITGIAIEKQFSTTFNTELTSKWVCKEPFM